MTKAEALAVCDELRKLVPLGPTKDKAKANRAKELVDSSATGYEDIPVGTQRSHSRGTSSSSGIGWKTSKARDLLSTSKIPLYARNDTR